MEAEAATARTVQASRLGVMSEDKPGGRVCRSHNLLLADRPIYQRTLRNPVCGHTFARCNIESRPDLADRKATDQLAQADPHVLSGALSGHLRCIEGSEESSLRNARDRWPVKRELVHVRQQQQRKGGLCGNEGLCPGKAESRSSMAAR